MQTQTIELQSGSPGIRQSLQVLRFGKPGARPKVYIQSALHADEVPAILVAQHLVPLLSQAEVEGRIAGEIVLVPFANPIGLGQTLLGQHQGRFDLRDGGNFNRGYAELATKVAERVLPSLTQDMAHNTQSIRKALVQAVDALTAANPTQDLKIKLLGMAVDADVVLDLHCDTDAVMHVYALTPQAAIAEQLARPWVPVPCCWPPSRVIPRLMKPVPGPGLSCRSSFLNTRLTWPVFGATVELRGEADTSHLLAEQDAQGLCAFLAQRGVLNGTAEPLRSPQCVPTPLSGSEPITAPHAGVVVFHRTPGERVVAGDVIADVVDALSGNVTQLRCKSDGLLYARCGSRWAVPGKRLAKIAGTSLARTGKLLSP